MDSEHPPTCQSATSSDTSANNGFGPTETGDGTRALPAGVLGSFLATAGRSSPLMQLFLPVYQILGSQLGPDPTLILTYFGVLWVIMKLSYQTYLMICVFIEDFLMRNVHVQSDDPLYHHVMKLLSRQKSVAEGSSIMAQTLRRDLWDSEEDLETVPYFTDGGDEGSGHQYLNFSRHASRVRPRFVPSLGVKTWFWYKNTFFVVSRTKQLVMPSLGAMQPMGDLEYIKISCLARSIQPAKALLAEASEMYHDDTKPKTWIHRPEFRDRGSDSFSWRVIDRRPVRSMRTVMLPRKTKEDLLQSMNEYLHPENRPWYSSKGIPYRRGYLFWGPPGTGKSSLCAAIAGVFGLPLFIVDLRDPNMTDDRLSNLFSHLPRLCIVLLEDIDAIGIKRHGDSGGVKNKGISETNKEDTQTGNLSLSGVLNAIDGVEAHEGHMLIMTTNRPESLDEALIRPGRVDHQTEFQNATTQQAAELFCRMYDDFTPTKPINKAPSAKEAAKDSKDGKDGKDSKLTASAASQANEVKVSPEEIKRLSEEFGERIPDGLCSPAEIQEFLLRRRKNPRGALDDLDSWVKGMMEQKESGSNIRKVQ